MSKKRKKKSPLRNEFTDALNVEMAERKIIERTQIKEAKDERLETRSENAPVEVAAVSLDKVSVENPATEKIFNEKVDVEKIPVEKISIEKVSAEKIEVEKVPAIEESKKIQIVEVKTDKKFEERILKEADKTFLDEKLPKVASKKSIYRSKAMQRWEEEQEEKEPPKIEPAPQIKKPRRMSHPERFGGIMSVVMLVYAFANMDKPLFFLALSLFAHFLSHPLGAVFGKYSDAVQNALHSFSIVIFFGAIMFLFTD